MSLRDGASDGGDGEERRDQVLRRSWLELALLVVGLAVLARIVVGIGQAPLVRVYQLAGPVLLLVIAPHALAALAITLSWWAVIPRAARAHVRFSRLIGAWLAGDALNYLLPSGTLGEVTKVRLMRHELPAADGTASVTLARLTDLFGLVAFGALGTGCAAAIGTELSNAVLLGGFAGVIALTVVVALVAWRGLFSGAVRVLRKLRLRRTAERLASAADRADADVKAFLRNDRRALVLSTAWRLVAWFTNVLEVWIVFRLLGLHASFVELVAMEGLIALWNGALFFVPARAGTTEGGWLLVAGMFGFSSDDALAIALLRRFRDTVWALLGLLMLAVLSVRKED